MVMNSSAVFISWYYYPLKGFVHNDDDDDDDNNHNNNNNNNNNDNKFGN